MSKKIFINNLNTFVSEQLMAELRNDGVDEEGNPNPDANLMFGTFIDKDSSEKPDGIKKMLKRSKPRLAMKYLSECDLIIYDLHAGNPQDVRLALEALKNTKFEEPPDKTLILVSSLMAWSGTDKNKEEIKTAEQLAEEAAAKQAAEQAEGDGEPKGSQDGSQKDEPETPPEAEDEEPQYDSDGNLIEKEEEVPEEEVIAPKIRPRYKHLPWTEADYQKRSPHAEYQIIKEIEDEVLSFKKEGIKTYVVSAGILYGKGEAIFNSHIKKAWLQDPVRLPYVGDGNNQLPTIHVTDLARIVKKISEAKPERNYIFAVDNNKKPTQKKLINAISNGIGTGLVESIDIPETFKTAHPKLTPIQLDLDWKKSLLLDLKVTPSSLFIKPEPKAGAPEEEGDGPEILELNWHCKSGLAENIQLVKEEFEKKRGLKPVKIFISGPPCSGKSFFGKQLAEHYNVPHIHMEKLLSDIKSWDQEKEDNWRKRVAERDAKVAEIKAEREAIKEKKRREEEAAKEQEAADIEDDGEPKEDAPAEEAEPPAAPEEEKGEDGEEGERPKTAVEAPIEVPLEGDSDDDFSEIEIKQKVIQYLADKGPKAKIDMSIITEAVRWRLNRNDCQNRGYVLDGITKTFALSKEVFVITPPPPPKVFDEEGNEVIDEEAKPLVPTLQKNIYPKSVICLNATDQFIRRRSKELLKNKQQGSEKWEPSKLAEKLHTWNETNHLGLFNCSTHGSNTVYPTYKFFQDNETELFELGANGSAYEIFESMRIYVERFGRPYNYLKSVGKLNAEREDHLVTEEKDTKQAEDLKQSEKEVAIREQKLALEKLADARLESVMAHMKELEDCDDLNMRQFLMKYIIPLLTEGMIEVWKVGPLDPVDYLADYIFKRSQNV